MDARVARTLMWLGVLWCTMGARHNTPNFVVETADPRLCVQIAQMAEQYRRELAVSWIGQTMPDWSQPCQMTVTVGPHLGAGGATTFVFDRGEVYGWRMNIQGSAERILDSVLPHEVTHMIFASHFRHPVPRWADEGGATSVEANIEKSKHRKMLIQFLQTNRGIAFNQMFAMTEYPPDVMPLYAQGYSLSEYLIEQGGRRKFIEFLSEGMQTGNWQVAVQRHYGPTDLGVLQNTWVAWVGQGSPVLAPRTTPESSQPATMVAATTSTPRPEPNLVLHLSKDGSALAARPQSEPQTLAAPPPDAPAASPTPWQPAMSADPNATTMAAAPAPVVSAPPAPPSPPAAPAAPHGPTLNIPVPPVPPSIAMPAAAGR